MNAPFLRRAVLIAWLMVCAFVTSALGAEAQPLEPGMLRIDGDLDDVPWKAYPLVWLDRDGEFVGRMADAHNEHHRFSISIPASAPETLRLNILTTTHGRSRHTVKLQPEAPTKFKYSLGRRKDRDEADKEFLDCCFELIQQKSELARRNGYYLTTFLGDKAKATAPSMVQAWPGATNGLDRRWILLGLSSVNPKEPSLLKFAEEALDDPFLRTDALFAIGRIGSSAQILEPRVVPLLSSTNESVRLEAIGALGGMGRVGEEAFIKILQLRNDSRPKLRQRANEALATLEVPLSLSNHFTRQAPARLKIFTGFLVPLIAFHILLFAFNPRVKTNLYYSLFTAQALALAWMPEGNVWGRFRLAGAPLLMILGLLLVYSVFQEPIRKRFWFIASAPLLLWFAHFPEDESPGIIGGFLSVLLGIAMIALVCELIRVFLRAIAQRKPGSVLIGLGAFSLFLAQMGTFFGLALPSQFSEERLRWLEGNGFYAGMITFVGFMSLHLAREFASTTSNLQQKTVELDTKNIALANSIEQLQRAQQAADEANKAKSQFLASVSHELRTPLNAIIGYSEILEEDAPGMGAAAMTPDIQRIHSSGKHLLSLINDILDLSKIEAGKMTLFVEEFDLSKLLKEVTATVQPMVAKNSNRLVLDFAASLSSMRSDQTKLRQVLFNLISNAAKFTEHGTITFRVQPLPDGSNLQFVVADSGIGMTPEQMTKLFQAFSQAENSIQKKYGGTGLGLILCKKFCEMMGGKIAVRSEHGKGSEFTATLPAVCPT